SLLTDLSNTLMDTWIYRDLIQFYICFLEIPVTRLVELHFYMCLYYKLLYRFESIFSTLSVSKDSLSTSSPLKLLPSCSISYCTRTFKLLGRWFSSNISYLQFFSSLTCSAIASVNIFS